MTALIIALITALVSFFASKKAGASDGEAALVAAGVGAGSYYVGTQTEWGKDLVSDIEAGWTDLVGPDDEVVLDGEGHPVKAPKGAQVVLDAEGNPVTDGSGNVLWKVVDTAGNVLTSWGAAGTAGVIATGSVAASDDLEKYIPWAIGGLALFALMK